MSTLKTSTIEEIKSMELSKVRKHPISALCAYSDFVSKDFIDVCDYLINADQSLKGEVMNYFVKNGLDTGLSIETMLQDFQDVYIDNYEFRQKADALIDRYFELTVNEKPLW